MPVESCVADVVIVPVVCCLVVGGAGAGAADEKRESKMPRGCCVTAASGADARAVAVGAVC